MKKCYLSERIPGVSEGLHGFRERLKQECSVVCFYGLGSAKHFGKLEGMFSVVTQF